jgi:hypothetical protein
MNTLERLGTLFGITIASLTLGSTVWFINGPMPDSWWNDSGDCGRPRFSAGRPRSYWTGADGSVLAHSLPTSGVLVRDPVRQRSHVRSVHPHHHDLAALAVRVGDDPREQDPRAVG